MGHFYVVMCGGNKFNNKPDPNHKPWLLSIGPMSYADCARAINWQHQGGNSEYMYIARRIGPTEFQAENNTTFQVSQGIYTTEAWDRFLNEWKNDING